MMKKLLILMLVMGLASTANATLTLVSSAGDTLDPGGTNTTMIGIYNDVLGPGQGAGVFLAVAETTLGKWTGVANSYAPPSPELAELIHYGVVDPGTGIGTVDLYSANLIKIPSTSDWEVGVLADFEFECLDMGDVTITMYADNISTPIDTMVIHQVPEPLTFGLLGLGGLFLRRRK
jgi:hypothetical protein